MRFARAAALGLSLSLLAACGSHFGGARAPSTVEDTASRARTPNGLFISWREHRIDDEGLSPGVALRGGDGLQAADFDADGYPDIVSVHEDSNHLRIAFGGPGPHDWTNITVGEGARVGAVEDVAVGDLNGDGWSDLIAACEEAHLIYFENPGKDARAKPWASLIPAISQGRGSWLRVFVADMDRDGRMDVLAANKGAADILDPNAAAAARPTSLFLIGGNPLDQRSWREQELSREVVPNTAMPVDIDGDGDLDVLTAARVRQTMSILENLGAREGGGILTKAHPIAIAPAFSAPQDWTGRSNAFQSAFADMNGDGRVDLVVAVHETPTSVKGSPLMAALGWLQQPADLDEPWLYHRIGDLWPDVVTAVSVADLDGDGDFDVVTGGYSGLNILKGGYTGASREHDSANVTASSTVGRIAWFEHRPEAEAPWVRHDVSRRVRGMYDAFVPMDVDRDGDLDLVGTRGNSGAFDGVFWLEQVRGASRRPVFTPARKHESRALPLPPADWMDHYEDAVTFVAPNKIESD